MIIVETDEDGAFVAVCPQYLGCVSRGKTIVESLAKVSEDISKYKHEI